MRLPCTTGAVSLAPPLKPRASDLGSTRRTRRASQTSPLPLSSPTCASADATTAITIVALGTSLPDTFASASAARGEPYADAAIGNVTGSNSVRRLLGRCLSISSRARGPTRTQVNVFLGLGAPWALAAIYWATQEPRGEFRVPSSGLGFSTGVYVICAMITLSTLLVRRFLWGAELGGPRAAKWATAMLFVGLWVTYVTASILHG